MRPLKLDVQAFGPFKEKLSLDFTLFKNENIFLISGPTGSGKTSIFDAISYAIYEQTTTDGRTQRNIKSDFADDYLECYVDLTFDHFQETYRIIRKPEQMIYDEALQRSKKQMSSVEIFRGKQLISHRNKTDSNKLLVDLLGMDFKQFSQIVLLAQGQFQRFLLSSSREKEEIFRDIFDTQAYKEFENELRKKVKAIEKEAEGQQANIDAQIKLIQLEDYSSELKLAVEKNDLPELIKQLKLSNQKIVKQVKEEGARQEKLQRELNSYQELFDALMESKSLQRQEKELKKQEKESKEHEKAIKQHRFAEELVNLMQKLDQLEERVKQLKNELDQEEREEKTSRQELLKNKKRMEEVKSQYDQLDQLREEEDRLRKFIDLFQEKDQIQSQIVGDQQDIQKKKGQLNEKAQAQATIESTQIKVDESLKKLEERQDERTHLLQSVEELEKEIKELQEDDYRFNQLENRLKSYKNEQKEYQESEEEFDSLSLEYREKTKLYRQNQAGLLADQLEVGSPCPVCGSTDHPKPARLIHTDVSEEEMDRLSEKYEQALSALSSQSEGLKQARRLIHESFDSLNVDEKTWREVRTSNLNHLQALKSKLESTQLKVTEIDQKLEEREGLVKQADNLYEEVEKLKSAQLELQVIIRTSQESLADKEDECKKYEEQLKNKNKTEIEQEWLEIGKQIKAVSRDYLNLKEEHFHLEEKVSLLKQSISHKNDQLKEKAAETEKTNSELQDLQDQSQLSSNYESYLLSKNDLESYQSFIESYHQDLILYQDRLRKNQAKLESYPQEEQDEVSSQKKIDDIKRRQEEAKEQIIRLKTQANREDDIIKNLESYHQENQDLLEEYDIYKDLDNIASGQAPETGNVSFERYVLSIYMDEILLAANRLFEDMTQGQFSMIREVEASNRQGKKGLEINVFDSYTGQERSVKSLSGGEIFKASLCLAIGMSEVIQEESGGVSVEMLFIDEGFGSLDNDSLHLAVESLYELNQAGRFIGIISHVEELKSQIPAQIHVEKTMEGSYAKIQA